MCRWFAYISPSEPCLLEDVLITPKHSLVKQVSDHYLPKLLPHEAEDNDDTSNDIKARNWVFNFDGLGVAWYTSSKADFELGGPSKTADEAVKEVRLHDEPYLWIDEAHEYEKRLRPAMYKTIQPPRNDSNFLSICANTETKCLFGHIRASSGTAIAYVNNHPFVFGRHTFMHNGAASDFQEIKRDVVNEMSPAAYANVYGGTDSEHMAGLYMTYLTNGGDASSFEKTYSIHEMTEALHKAVATIITLQQKRLAHNKRPNSLNLCATDGIKLVAYRFRNHRTSQPPSLYYSTKAGVTLNRKYPDNADGIQHPKREIGIPEEKHGEHLIVASEPSTYKEADWELIPRNSFLAAGPDGVFEVKECPYVEDWNAEDPPSK
ncbi:putative glutamine amidotransferase DUG3 [Pseudocercospora fuligena]|uniref:Putative glutamine amidotransferase DUG3 n=1 Tax=Pseudocercospora fuligena TaxID=685502 RepID=A0A8H6VLX1_9PEZI|nr:putative glutamine amidotransferase DUG3 [Pseudocercospora fuligena]